LSAFSDKGVFTKELDIALLSKDIDIAVHSMKDLPTTLPEGICLAAVPPRGNVHDAMVFPAGTSPEALAELGRGKNSFVVGSSSLRRRAMLFKWFAEMGRSNLNPQHIRGNVNSRLRKLDSGEFDALLLACAGLERLKMEDRISISLGPPHWNYYAVCQGALAIVCRSEDARIRDLLSVLSDSSTLVACTAERSMLRTLEGGCKVPIGVRSETSGKTLMLSGTVLSVDGTQSVEASESTTLTGDTSEDVRLAEELGIKVAGALVQQGADKILESIRSELQEDHTALELKEIQK
jgi:hydroxymethylbilane synthase